MTGPPEPNSDGPDLVGVSPTERFPCGALYPITPAGEGIDPASDDVLEEDCAPSGSGEVQEEPAIVRRYTPPSSLGFSFFISGGEIRLQILCRAAQYVRQERDEHGQYTNKWTRRELAPGSGDDEVVVVTSPASDSRESSTRLGGRARLDVEWRRFANGWLVTLSLCNAWCVSAVGRGSCWGRGVLGGV